MSYFECDQVYDGRIPYIPLRAPSLASLVVLHSRLSRMVPVPVHNVAVESGYYVPENGEHVAVVQMPETTTAVRSAVAPSYDQLRHRNQLLVDLVANLVLRPEARGVGFVR